MAFVSALVSHNTAATLQLSSFLFDGDAKVSASAASASASSTLFMGAQLIFGHPLPLSCSKLSRQLVVCSTRLSGLEETVGNGRESELRTSSTYNGRPALRCGNVSQQLPVPDHIPKPPYVSSKLLPEISSEHQIHDSEGIARMRAACELAARVVDYAGSLVRDGDIINIDVAVYINGYHGDTSKTFLCGNVNDAMKQLVKVTEECMYKGIAVCKDGALFRNIGEMISEHAEKNGYVVDHFIGHGIGTILHSEPLIFNQRDEEGGHMVEGQTFTIEPILTLGTTDFITWEDKWTILTADGSPAAQFEHTILITKTGAEILTKY